MGKGIIKKIQKTTKDNRMFTLGLKDITQSLIRIILVISFINFYVSGLNLFSAVFTVSLIVFCK